MKLFEKISAELKLLRWQNFIFLLIAGCVNAFGVTVFLAPVNLYDSGISGPSILLSQISRMRGIIQAIDPKVFDHQRCCRCFQSQ